LGQLGVAVFLGMGQSVAENVDYLRQAKRLGYSRLFTSLHIPEADYRQILSEGRQVLAEAGRLGFEVAADVSPQSWKLLNLQPEELEMFGIATLRVDWGFGPEQMKELAERSGLKIEVNASTTDERSLHELLAAGFDRKILQASHNYYPRPETGLSFSLFVQRSQLLKQHGMEVSAFIPSRVRPRGPIFAGLPTVESHRRMSPVAAARQLWASGVVNTIFFGDPLASEDDLASVASLPMDVAGPLELRVGVEELPAICGNILWAPLHTNRLDSAEYVARSQESRGLCVGLVGVVETRPRLRGDVTVDNVRYGRYMGELQIALRDLPADERVNIVGRVIESDLCLLDCLTPGRTFRLKETVNR
jgi:hypothetical protein